MYEYIGDKTPEDFICGPAQHHLLHDTEKRGRQGTTDILPPVASNSLIIREYQQEENLFRRQELLRRMERVFTEEATERRLERASLQATQKKRPGMPRRVDVNSSFTQGMLQNNSSSRLQRDKLFRGAGDKMHLVTPMTTMSTTGHVGRIVLPSTVARDKKAPPLHKQTKKSQAAAGAIRNQLYYPSPLNEDGILPKSKILPGGSGRHGRRGSNEFQVHYLNSVKQLIKQRRSKVSKMKIADYFRSQHASMKEESPEEGARLQEEPDAYFPPRTFGHHRYSDSRVEQKPKRAAPLNAYYPQQSLIDREKAF